MKTLRPPKSLFDPSLTPQNAGAKRYKYIDDIFYDFINPDEVVNDILAFLREFDGKLGVPANRNGGSYFGLYLPNDKI